MKVLRFVTVCFLFLLLVGCKPRVVTQLQIQRDTTYITKHSRDSVYFRDSVWIKEYVKGDTVRIMKYHDRWRERVMEVHDTLIQHQTDTVYKEKRIVKEVNKPIKGFKKIKLNAFWWILAIAVIGWRKEVLNLVRHIIALF